VLVPDFRGRDDRALEILKAAPPDVMNHNLETIPRLYKEARPGSDYQFSLNLLKKFKALHPDVPTKSGLMVGLGETDDEILEVMRDMRAHGIDMLTIGQYLAPSTSHLPVRRYVHPDTFKMFEAKAYEMGFTHAAVGAMVRSSYHADQQAHAGRRPALQGWTQARLDQPLALADLAARAHLSPSQFALRCHEAHGVSAMHWLRQQKLARARQLRALGLPVAEVARRTGYRSPSALTAALRREP
jgi:AraC-like DNA-binding protein